MDINNLKYGGVLIDNLPSDSKLLATVRNASTQKKEGTSQVKEPTSNATQNPGMRVQSYNVKSMTAGEYEEARNQRFKVSYKLSNPMGSLVKPYQQAIEQLSESHLTTVSKDWDLGVDKNNEILIYAGNDGLSSQEIRVLTSAFDNPIFKEHIKAFQNAVIEASSGEFRYDKEPGSVAHYNLNVDNINEVIRSREFIIQKSRHQFHSFESLRDQLLERGSDFIKPEAANMKLVDIYT